MKCSWALRFSEVIYSAAPAFKRAIEEYTLPTRDGSRFSNIRIFYLIIEYRLG